MKDLFVSKLPFIPPEKVFAFLKKKDHFIWLDSCMELKNRFSVMAFEPFLIFSSKKKKISLHENGSEKLFEAEPLVVLEELLSRYMIPRTSFFSPGALGYFAYDLGWQLEKLPDAAADDLSLPDIYLGFYQSVILFDHGAKNIQVISANTGGLKKKDFENSCQKTADMLNKIGSMHQPGIGNSSLRIDKITSNMGYPEYVKGVEKIRDYITEGDVYQVNFARRIEAEGVFPGDEIYLKLRSVNPTSFSAFFDAGNFQILSNSPELFVKKSGSRITTVPMKGTRPRGKNRKEDALLRKELLLSEKEKAELVMIVDLERNDIGRVCRFGSVRVKNLRRMEKYETVFQTTSAIEGCLREEVSQAGLLRATFPGGSVTGAPKIRAMEIIEELEPCKRAFYTGSMGYVGFNGDMELNLLIRTILLKDSRLYYPAGGGIVWDSVPDEEFRETQAKAEALFLTLGAGHENILSL